MHSTELSPEELHALHTEFLNRKGEANLFVIRKIADKQDGGTDFILEGLKKHYKIITVKPVSWVFRFFKSGKMRGGKWKRGGKPMHAVVVFDPAPINRDKEEMKDTHPQVFNARQFFKPELRQAFADKYGVKLKLNPIHSTDNEFEAWEHLDLLFDENEIEEINKKVAAEREAL